MGKEDIKGLFERFCASDKAEQSAEEIRAGEQLFSERRSPEPGVELIAAIKTKVGRRLAKRVRRRIAYKAVAAAAAILVFGLSIWFWSFERVESPIQRSVASSSKMAGAVWDSNDIVKADTKLAFVNSEFDRIKEEMHSMESGESDIEVEEALFKLENELLAVNGNFWKE